MYLLNQLYTLAIFFILDVTYSTIILKNLYFPNASFKALFTNTLSNGIPVSHSEQNYKYPYLHFSEVQKLWPHGAKVIIFEPGTVWQKLQLKKNDNDFYIIIIK